MLTVFRRLFQKDRVRKRFPDDPGTVPGAFRGMPRIDVNRCCGHKACVEVCPSDAIQVDTDTEGWVWELDRSRCLACGLCMDVCPEQALMPGPDFELAARTRESLVQRARIERRSGGESV